MPFSSFATDRYRWWALLVLALGLAIVIIDNTVLNVAIPYILRDLHTSLDAIQWVVSGYALIIATLLITMGRVGDLWGRKRMFLLGTVFFAVGSFIASLATKSSVLFIGEALIEAVGAAMMLTSTLALLVSEFQGRERAIAFGIWGSVAGASATLGPLLGGYLTTHYSWRWSLRINVVVALIAIVGSVFIKESKGRQGHRFDWLGMILSAVGLFSLIFAFIEGRTYGWWKPKELLTIGSWSWHLTSISIIPIAFATAACYLLLFIMAEYLIERSDGEPLVRLSLFQRRGFSLGLLTLAIISLGQFGIFFILPIYLQNVLQLDAFQTGLVFLPASIAIGIFGPLSGFVASRISPKWVVSVGMIVLSVGSYMLIQTLQTDSTGWSLLPSLAVFGVGIGMTGAQLTNIILSAVPPTAAGEASAVNNTVRQVGTSIGVSLLGVIFASTLLSNMTAAIERDENLPAPVKIQVVRQLNSGMLEAGRSPIPMNAPAVLSSAIRKDKDYAFTQAAKKSLHFAVLVSAIGTVLSFLIPAVKPVSWEKLAAKEEASVTAT